MANKKSLYTNGERNEYGVDLECKFEEMLYELYEEYDNDDLNMALPLLLRLHIMHNEKVKKYGEDDT